MATFPGILIDAPVASTFIGRNAAAYTKAAEPVTLTVNEPLALGPQLTFSGVTAGPAPAPYVGVSRIGKFPFEATPGIDFFEKIHVMPRELLFENVLTTQSVPMAVMNAFRHASQLWNSYTNNAGAGVTLVGMPSLPTTLSPLYNFVGSYEISTNGAPFVKSTLDFSFAIYDISIPIELNRIVLFAVAPELPYKERLEFLTDLVVHKRGTEQRTSLRKGPRQFFAWHVILDDGDERMRVHNMLFDWQARAFGIPMWHELTHSTAAASAGASTINVLSTAHADYRVGALALVYQDQKVFDVLEVLSLTGTSVTFVSPLLNSYAAGVQVMPLRTGFMSQAPSGNRWPSGAASMDVVFRVSEEAADLADVSGWATFLGKPLVDDLNGVSGTMPDVFEWPTIELDNGVGIVFTDNTWDRNKQGWLKTFLCRTQQDLWKIRQLMHALRGRQVAWYLAFQVVDFEPTVGLTSGTTTLSVKNSGYSRFVRSRAPRNKLRVTFNDGTAAIIRTIVSSEAIDVDNETLTVNATWPSTKALSTIEKIDLVQLVRLDTDAIDFEYHLGERLVKVFAPVKAVQE